jgi:hypothetical protein
VLQTASNFKGLQVLSGSTRWTRATRAEANHNGIRRRRGALAITSTELALIAALAA